MRIILNTFSFRFAEQVINSKLALKQEIEEVLTDTSLPLKELTRPNFNKELDQRFVKKGWESQPYVFGEKGEPMAKMDFLKDRVGIEVEFGHSSFLGIDLLKMQISSYSALDKIDLGIYIATTRNFQKTMHEKHRLTWDGSLSYEKIVRYLPHFKSAITVPIYVYGIDVTN